MSFKDDVSFSWILAALVLAFGFLGAGFFVKQGLSTFRMEDRVVTVKGLAERDVEADLAMWTLSHSGTSNVLAEVQQKIENNEKIILAYLEHKGFGKDEVTVQPLQAQDLLAQAYRPQGVEQGRYIITQMITIRTSDMEKMGQAVSDLGSLLRQGVTLTNSAQPTYMFTKLNQVKPEMLADAVKSARKAAEEFARDSGQDVGGIKRAYQGLFQILPRDPVAYVSEQNQRYKRVRVVSTFDFYLQ